MRRMCVVCVLRVGCVEEEVGVLEVRSSFQCKRTYARVCVCTRVCVCQETWLCERRVTV